MSKEESIRSVICGNLNRLLNERRMTQKELSDFMGVSASTVNDWVRGKKIPRMDKVDKLCSIFGVSREEILYDHSSRTNPASSAPPAPQKSIEVSPAQKEDREHKHLQNLLSDPHLRRILESSGQLNESSLQEVQNFIDFQLGKKKQ